MRRRFSRGRRSGSSGDSRNESIDAGRWFERIAAAGLVSAESIEPVEVEGVPGSFAALGSASTEQGDRVAVAFSPQHGGDAVLAGLALGQRMAEADGFAGELVTIAPQWSIPARRRLALVGKTPFRVRAVAASSLQDGVAAVAVEADDTPAWLPPQRVADELADAGVRELFLRALAAFEGLAAKHGGAVRGAPSSVELVLMARRVATLRVDGGEVVLEALLPQRTRAGLDRAGLPGAMDRLEGQLRKRLNDRRLRSSDEGLRAEAAAALAAAAGLRATRLWPLGGADPEILDLAGIDADGRPVLGAVRRRLGLAELGVILDAALAARSSLPLLFAGASAPVRLAAPRLLLAASEVDSAVIAALAGLALDHGLYDVLAQRSGAPEVVLRGASTGAPALAETPPPRSQAGGRSRRARPPRSGRGARDEGRPAREREKTGSEESPREEAMEELSLMDLDDDARPRESATDEPERPRRRRRGRRRGRRGGGQEPAADETRASEGSEGPGSADEAAPATPEDEDVDVLLGSDEEIDPSALLAPLDESLAEAEEPAADYEDEEEFAEESDEAAWARERVARKRARLAKIQPEPEPEAPRRPRKRSAIVAHADRASLAAAVLLARDIRLVEGFWIYPQSELMTFFRSVATDLRPDTPICMVGFTARPARDVIQAAALYAGRLAWYDHHDWPPEDLESLRRAIGAENVEVQPGSGSSLPAVLANRVRRSRFSDKLVELVTGRFTQHDYERWGRLWWHRLGEIAQQPGERRAAVDALLTGRPSDLAREASAANLPPEPAEVVYVSERDFRVVHFGGYALVVVVVPPELDVPLTARVARERFGAQISVAHREGEELVVLGADEGGRGRRGMDLGAMVTHLAAKHDWTHALRDEDHVARIRVERLGQKPERLDEVVSEIAMGRSIFEG